ncbi:putative PLP-dependent aminotransferase [Polynucleobacter bastaniensis]|uniref:putative PLP-dependent aminotransferase n=1 Tax=Polynucleobacter bastaniensis TaxID=2081039 RepID=UPI001C0E0FC6|nr:putative PLP-dependent aminotransferase [Polynucleobacter bastaniensis]
MKIEHFLWPKSNLFNVIKSLFCTKSIEKVEARLHEMFPSGYPVLFSSGRAALSAALLQSNVSRKDFVGVFSYASHCVLDTISRVSTPLSGPYAKKENLRVVYHQWGFVQEVDLPENTIEDCVDTLCKIGTKLFPGGGSFEIWSLPKILGTTSGGVLWCRTEKSALIAQKLRDNRGGGVFLWSLRLFGKVALGAHLCWEGIEPNMGGISKSQVSEIFSGIKNWEKIVSMRQKNLEILWPYALSWLPKPVDRLPCAIPIQSSYPEGEIAELGLSAGYRMIERMGENAEISVERVLPIPIHQDIDRSWINHIIKMILNKG